MPLVRRAAIVKARPAAPAAAMSPAEAALARVALRALSQLQQSTSLDLLEAGLRAGGVSALNAVDFSALISALNPATSIIGQEIASAATAQALVMKFGMSFTKVDPNVVRAAELGTGHMITAITDATREAIRRIVTLGIATQQLTVKDMAGLIRTTIGLAPSQALALRNTYESTLSAGLAAGLSREVATARAQKLADKVRARGIKSRAETIARTEVMTAQNAGRYASWEAAAAKGLIKDNAQKEWVATESERTCSTCRPLDGRLVPWNSPFPGIGNMPPAHPRCRCTAVLKPAGLKQGPQYHL
jgi:SPP1 gp7 family putative phage head morphogenesis protein